MADVESQLCSFIVWSVECGVECEMFNVLLHKLEHHQVLRLPRQLARKAKETSHLTQPRQCGKRQVQSRKCPKYSTCHAE